LPPDVPNRKLRLFALACCQRIETILTHPLSRRAVMLSEQYAEGFATDEAMRALSQQFMAEYNARRAVAHGDRRATHSADLDAAYSMTLKEFPASAASSSVEAASDKSRERLTQCQLLRCIFGNPFRPVSVNPAWLTSDVRALAAGIYQDKAFDRMPILADALQDAGCDNDDILNHCRDTSATHVRGCWVVDLVLGKE
jgi:hypothetical protein